MSIYFTGKEKDAETGYGYFGARYMDHELMSNWLSVDPMADKYPGISPYAYCAWNPVKMVDPDGRELVLTGESENVNNLLKIINSCFSFSSDVFEIVDGKVQARKLTSNEMDNMSMKQKGFYNTVMSAINDEKTISIDVVNNSKSVLFGSWKSSSIDVADMTALGDGEGMNMYSVIGHEISEQQYKQTSSRPNYLIGHYRYGMKAEDNISGCFRGTESGFGNPITFNFSNYSESARIQVNIQLGSDKSIESVERTKYPLNFGY